MTAGVLDLLYEQGTTLNAQLKLKNSSGDPLDISGCVLKGQVRSSVRSATVLAEFVFTPIAPTIGEVGVSIAATSLDNLKIKGDTYDDYQELVYDIEMTYPSGNIIRVLNGAFRVSPQVTRS